MKRSKIQEALAKITKETDAISDNRIKNIHTLFLNLVEALATENERLQVTVQQQNDEINRLKGEQGKPNINKQKNNGKGNNDNKGKSDHSSEKNRKPPKNPSNKKPKKNITIDRQVKCTVNKDELPNDLQFKGYKSTIIQNIVIKPDNIEFQREIYYSPSLKKTYIAELPDGCHGGSGPELRAAILMFYHESKMTSPAIKRFLSTFDIPISKGQLSRTLTDNHEEFHQEKEDIVDAGLLSTPYQHFDDTGSRVNGKNHYTHVLCNPFYTAYFTELKKDRLTALKLLCREELKFTFNQDSFQMMSALGVPEKHLTTLKGIVSPDVITTRAEVDHILDKLFPPSEKAQKENRRIILESAAISFYQSTKYAIEYLICDDAPQFNNITKYKVLCWVHEGRHYKKLNPVVPLHRTILDDFIDNFWSFYKDLLSYKENPLLKTAEQLSKQFDELFSTKTGYDQLDERIAKTLAKKTRLMLVLEFHFLPLENNPAELGARVEARHRDINLQTRNEKGTRAKDTFATLVQTARKLQVNVFKYLLDRINKKYDMPSLADLIKIKSQPTLDSS